MQKLLNGSNGYTRAKSITVESSQTHKGGCIFCATNKISKTEHHINSDTTADTSRHYHVRWQKHKPRRRRRYKIISYATSLCTWNVLTILMISITTTTTVMTTNALAVSLPVAAEATLIEVTLNTTTKVPINSSNALLTLNVETIPTPTTTIISSANRSSGSNNNNNKNTRLRKRHSKRHSDWDDYYNYNESILEWANPCGGNYDPTQKWGGATFGGGAFGGRGGRVKKKTPKQIFNNLKKSVGNEFKTLSANQQVIDISNIQIWFLHEYTYKFLPKLKANSSIALKRWHRNFQTYVASFAYLRRVQLKWEHSKTQRESRTARELKDLFLSSRSMLCELEMAINNTHPYQPHIVGGKLQQKQFLQIFTREQINKRLKLRTKRRAERSPPEALHEADTIDLKFVKYYYYEFLETMWKVLRKNMKRRGQIAIHTNRKEFNEVSKNFGSLPTMSAGRLRMKNASWLQVTEQSRRSLRRAQKIQRQRSLRKPQTIKTTLA